MPTFFPINPSELAPLLNLLATPSAAASAATTTAPAPSRRCGRGPRSRNAPYPRFDVQETAIAFELHGEVPGIRQEDISIEFVDADTLVIRGHTAGVVERKNQSSTEVSIREEEATTSAAAAESPNTLVDEEKTSNSYKVTVEDEDDEFVDAGAELSDGEATPTTSIAAQPIEAAPAKEDNQKKDEHEKDSKPKYWIHERSTGRFERGFRFPSLVDRDNVKANLKDGILSIVVPKVERKERRIVVE